MVVPWEVIGVEDFPIEKGGGKTRMQQNKRERNETEWMSCICSFTQG